MTPYQDVFDVFLTIQNSDEWVDAFDPDFVNMDLTALLEAAIVYFKLPSVSVARDGVNFTNDLTDVAKKVLANLMRQEWLKKNIYSWSNITAQYSESDYSPANILDKLTKLMTLTNTEIKALQKEHSRLITNDAGVRVPYDYSKLAGSGQ